VLDILFHAMVRYAAPVLVFTAEEVWATRFPDAGSVHLLEWPILPITRHPSEGWGPSRLATEGGAERKDDIDPSLRWGDELAERWVRVRTLRENVTAQLENLRRDKIIGSSLEGKLKIGIRLSSDLSLLQSVDFEEICIAGTIQCELNQTIPDHIDVVALEVTKTTHHKCGRCWRHLPEVSEDGALCDRCDTVLSA
jgi:isoleucyl-tRNA synthetase